MRKRFIAVSELGKPVKHYDLDRSKRPDLWEGAIISTRHIPGLNANAEHHCDTLAQIFESYYNGGPSIEKYPIRSAIEADAYMDFQKLLVRNVLGSKQYRKLAVIYESHQGCEQAVDDGDGNLIDCVGQTLSKLFQGRS